MAIIKPLSQEIVKGFKNTLVFYKMKGQHIVRTWPRNRPGPGTPAQEFCKDVKRGCHAAAKQISPAIRDALIQNTSGSGFTWLDFWMSMCMKAYYLAGKLPIYLLDFNYWFESPEIHIEYTLSEEGPHSITRHRISKRFPTKHVLGSSYLAGCDVPIEPIPDCLDDMPGTREEIATITGTYIETQMKNGIAYHLTDPQEAYNLAWEAYLFAEWEESGYSPFACRSVIDWGGAMAGWVAWLRRDYIKIRYNFSDYITEEEFEETDIGKITLNWSKYCPLHKLAGAIIIGVAHSTQEITEPTTTLQVPRELFTYPITELQFTCEHLFKEEFRPIDPTRWECSEVGNNIEPGFPLEIGTYKKLEYPHIETPEICTYQPGDYIKVSKSAGSPEVISPYFLIK